MRAARLFSFIGFIFCILFYHSNVSAIAPKAAQQEFSIDKDKIPPLLTFDKNIAYTIYIPGKDVGNGQFTPAKFYRIPKLEQKYYMQNTIHVKTKTYYSISKGAKGFQSSVLQSSLEDLGIEAIRAPYADFAEGNLLSVDKYGISRIYELKYSAPVDPYDVCKDLIKNPEVEYAVPVFIQFPYDYTPNDPGIGSQWYVNTLMLKKAWEISKGDKNMLIGIVDSGEDTDHSDLAGHIWTNTKEIPGNGIDEDGNGKKDDVHGWDFVGNINQTQANQGSFKPDNDPKPAYGSNFHGTHVSGCASAVTDNSVGIAGTGFNCSLLPVKCGSDDGNIPGIYMSYEGIMYAAKTGAKVINCSWGGPGYSPADQEVINQVVEMGAVVVVSAGNGNAFRVPYNIDEHGNYPASYDNVLCVGASGTGDRPSYFSNYGNAVTVYAPGESIYSTLPNNQYGSQQGTSMSSPVTAGVVALLRSFKPGWTPKQILHQIRSTSDNVLTSDPNLRQYYYGRLNAFKALDYNGHNLAMNVPGVEASKITIQGKDVIDNYDNNYLRFEITNYLATVSNLKVTVQVLNNTLSLTQSVFNIGVLTMNQSKNMDVTVKLLGLNPWYSGFANILLKFENGSDYTDYQLVKIPIDITSKNSFKQNYAFPDWFMPAWYSGDSPSVGVFWAAGYSPVYGGIFLRYGSNGVNMNKISNDKVYAVAAISQDTAFIGDGPSSGAASIMYTYNAGANWNSTNVSSITGFINGIKFFDKKNGVLLGDPKGTTWGIGRTADGGKTWNQVFNLPAPQTKEAGFVGSYYWLGDFGWYGTNAGRVLRTSNRGAYWNVSTVFSGGFVFRMGFRDSVNGVAAYTESSDMSGTKWLAATNNGGSTWQQKKYNLTANGMNPVNFFTAERSGKLYMLCDGGQVFSTTDNGGSWESVLTQQGDGAEIGAANSYPSFRAQVWEASLFISTLDFAYVPPNAKRELTLLSKTTLNFDTTDIDGSPKTGYAEVKNTGEVLVNFQQAELEFDNPNDSTEFSFTLPPPQEVDVAKTVRFRLKFTPKKEGLRTATLIIKSDATNGDFSIKLTGWGRKPTDVDYPTTIDGNILEQNQPNPCVDFTNIPFSIDKATNVELSIYNSAGELIENLYSNYLDKGRFVIPLTTEKYASGLYFYRLSVGDKILTKSFIIKK